MLTKSVQAFVLLSAVVLGGAKAPLSLEEAVLSGHNSERAQLGVPPLRWNDELARGAEEWASHLAVSGTFAHSPDEANGIALGENIWSGTAGRFGPARMVSAWISERRHFKAGLFPDNSITGQVEDVSHYTQIVWRDTRDIGCAISRGGSVDIMVCRYQSPGNVRGKSPI